MTATSAGTTKIDKSDNTSYNCQEYKKLTTSGIRTKAIQEDEIETMGVNGSSIVQATTSFNPIVSISSSCERVIGSIE